MRKQFLKYLLILVLLGGGTMIFLYAQKGYIFRKPASGNSAKEIEKEEQADDIGSPTNDNPWKEMDKLVTAYYNEQGSLFKGTVKLIDDNGDEEKIIEEHPFQYSVLKDNFYYSLDRMEVVQKKDIILVVDHNNQLISMSSIINTSTKAKKLFDIGEFKKLMKEQKAEAKVTQLGNEKILTIENIQDPQVQGYRIYYNSETYKVNKMLIGMIRLAPLEDTNDDGVDEIPEETDADNKQDDEDNNRWFDDENAQEEPLDTYTYYMEIIYTETSILNVTEQTFNPENKFILVKNKSAELTQPYKNYQLITNNKQPEKEIQKKIEEE